MTDIEDDTFAFVIMPFDERFKDVYELGIKATSEELSVRAERLDEQIFSEGMLDRIYRQIEVADFIIADLSTRNANVFYELGYAHAKDKICILLANDINDIPFDLKHKRIIIYDTISGVKDELKKSISWAKNESLDKKNNKISVTSKEPFGSLTVNKRTAVANLTFKFDLHNNTNKTSPEITALYLYSGKLWDIKQDEKECPYSDSDIESFKYRYSITPSARRIGKNGWCQIKIKANKIMAKAWEGDEIKSEYNLNGKGILRLETTEENYDHEFHFNIDIEDIPF